LRDKFREVLIKELIEFILKVSLTGLLVKQFFSIGHFSLGKE
jgi:hypothetical protein